MMRQLNWKQPYAELMFHGKVETRTWDTKYRGLVLIVASKAQYTFEQVNNIAGSEQHIRIMEIINPLNLRPWFGHAIGVGTLVDSRPMQPEDEDACFVKYFPDLFCHVYRDCHRIRPFPVKGTMGWSTVDPKTEEFILKNLIL